MLGTRYSAKFGTRFSPMKNTFVIVFVSVDNIMACMHSKAASEICYI